MQKDQKRGVLPLLLFLMLLFHWHPSDPVFPHFLMCPSSHNLVPCGQSSPARSGRILLRTLLTTAEAMNSTLLINKSDSDLVLRSGSIIANLLLGRRQ